MYVCIYVFIQIQVNVQYYISLWNDTQYTVKENTNITYVRVTMYTPVGLTFPLKAWFARSKVLLSAPLGILCEQH